MLRDPVFRLFVAAIMLMLWPSAPSRAQQAGPPGTGEPDAGEWRKYAAGPVELYSNAGPKRARWLAAFAASRSALFEAIAPVAPEQSRADAAPVQPIRVMHFRDLASFLPFRIAAGAPAFHIGGGGRSLVLMHELGDDLTEIVNHEFFHVYTEHAGVRLPVWLAEGLGDYFATLSAKAAPDGSVLLSMGAPLARHHRSLLRRESLPLDAARLFAVTSETRHRGGEDPAMDFYAQCWLLAHLFQSQSPWREGFAAFVAAIPEHGSAGALAQVYGATAEDLNKAAASYLAGGQFPVRHLRLAAPPANDTVRELAMAPWEARLLMADVLAFRGLRSAARSNYEALGREFPSEPAVRESLAWLALDELRLEEAASHLEAAASLGSLNGEAYFRLATLRCGMQSEDRRCLDWLSRAVDLAPWMRELRSYAVDYALNVTEYRRALSWMEGFPASDDPQRFDLTVKRAYASYQLQDLEQARAAIAEARLLASTPSHRKTIIDLEQAIRERETFALHMELFRGAGESTEEIRKAAFQRLLERFATDPRAVVEVARLLEIRCAPEGIALLVQGPSGRRKLLIENAMDLMVLEGTERRRELDLTCGVADGSPVRVGYLTDGALQQLEGRLRILQFRPDQSAPDPR